MITGMNHVSFTVADLEKAVVFWKLLGFEGPGILRRRGDWATGVTSVPGATIRVAHLYGFGHHVEFIEYAGGSRRHPTALPYVPGTGHICLDVKNILATSDALLRAGATPLGRMTEIKAEGMVPGAAGYMRDPNGIIIELYERFDS
jgi:catechol 2,3-dioxygenase-like lactoylglutathione lyase family enzyme